MLNMMDWNVNIPCFLRFSRQQADLEALRVTWRAGRDRSSIQQDPAGVGVIDAVDGVGDLGDTGTDKPVKTDDSPGLTDDIDIVVFTSPPEADKFESRLGLRVDLPFVLGFGQDAANHQLDDLAHRQLLDRVRADGSARRA